MRPIFGHMRAVHALRYVRGVCRYAKRSAIPLLTTVLWSWPAVSYSATEVNACGQSFSGDGFLVANLDCTGFGGDAVVINGNGSLDLRGFTLTGGNLSAVYCTKGCKIESEPFGGQIVNADFYGINGDLNAIEPGVAPVRLKNVTVSGNAFDQVAVEGTVTIEDSAIIGTGGALSHGVSGTKVKVLNSSVADTDVAVIALRGLRVIDCQITNAIGGCLLNVQKPILIRGSTLTGCGALGVLAIDKRLRVLDSTISGGAGDGINADIFTPVLLLRSEISGNAGRGIATGGGKQLVLQDSTITGNGEEGVYHPGRARIVGTTITGNGRSGFSSGPSSMSSCGPIKVISSTVTGNGTDGAVCGVSETCADLSTCTEAAILTEGSVCDTSYDTDSGFPGSNWAICSLD